MTTRQRYIVWVWIGAIVATCICPPWHQGNISRGYGLIFAPPRAMVDLSRLSLEWVAITAVFAGLYFAWPSTAGGPRWKVPRIRPPRRAIIGLLSLVGIMVCVWSAWGLSRISRPLPVEELARLTGLCSASPSVFSGKIHNDSQSWTIREIVVRLTLKAPAPAPISLRFSDIPEVAARQKKMDWGALAKEYGATLSETPPAPVEDVRDYRISDLSIPPLETRSVSTEVIFPAGLQFGEWRIVSAKGFKNLWYGTEKISGVPLRSGSTLLDETASNVPSAIVAPRARSAKLDDIDNLISGLPDQPKAQKPPRRELRVVSSEPLAGSSPTARQRPLDRSDRNIPEERPVSIQDAENSGFVRTSFRNPEGSSSGDSVLLIVVKIGGPDRLVLTIPPGLVLKSPVPASQDMIVAGLKGRDAGAGKYTPASAITLTDSRPARYVIEAYCAEFHKDNPPVDNDLGVGTSVDPGMVCVLNEARTQGLSVAGVQAAVWIHAEHVTFSQMNTRMPIGQGEWSRAEVVALRCASR